MKEEKKQTQADAKKLYDPLKDPAYQDPYIDVEEPRERMLVDGTIIPFHYVHGGFRGTGVKFIFCMPVKERYGGHFIQYLSPFPGPDEEVASLGQTGEDDKISFALQNGFYFVESNMGSTSQFAGGRDFSLMYKTSAAVAMYSKTFAMAYYKTEKKPYGYVYGGSGGGYKTMACIENTSCWDGACPYVIGSPVSLPNTITMHVQGERLLRNAFPKIVDAVDCGGLGDPYEGLDETEKAALHELTNQGIPMKAWAPESRGKFDAGSLPVLIPGVKAADPSYFEDFWTKPGYEGHDDVLNAKKDRIYFKCTVRQVYVPGTKSDNSNPREAVNGVDTAWKKMLTSGGKSWIEVDQVPEGDDLYIGGTNIHFLSGDAKDQSLLLGGIDGHILSIGMCYGMDDLAGVLGKVKPGDEILLDNSDYIAIQYYYRHQVPKDTAFHAWDQFRNPDGTASLPQRPFEMGYGFTGTGTVQDGCSQGKVIITQTLADESTCPWCADWYYRKTREAHGGEDTVRLYYFENAMHNDVAQQSTFYTNYQGQLKQSLLDCAAWVEYGKKPLPSTNYMYKGGQIEANPNIEERGGLQPMVDMTVNGEREVEITAGTELWFNVKAQVPKGAGYITRVDYDFSEEDNAVAFDKPCFLQRGTFERTQTGDICGAVSRAIHVYDRPGTYYAAVRVCADRHGSHDSLFTQVRNIARVKVVVRGKAPDMQQEHF